MGHTKCAMFGRGVGMQEMDALRFVRKLVIDGVITEQLYNTKFDTTVAYAELTELGRELASGRNRMKVLKKSFVFYSDDELRMWQILL